MKGLGNKQNIAANEYGGEMKFRIEGKDLVTAIDRQNYSNNMNT